MGTAVPASSASQQPFFWHTVEMRPSTVTVVPSRIDGSDATSDAARADPTSTDAPYVWTFGSGADDGSDWQAPTVTATQKSAEIWKRRSKADM
jgi:hypothetical protein